MSYTLINHRGLSNFGNGLPLVLTYFFCVCNIKYRDFFLISEGQGSVRTLSLRGCPEVDDWFLARLHIFRDSLEELDISHCPLITIGGLPALRNLR